MTRYLLDTHALLWWLFDDTRLPAIARGVISDRQNDIYVSSASAWEIATKWRLGKLNCAAPLVADFEGWLHKAALRQLPITVAHANHAGGWRQAHRDPFDRMLAAQSVLEELPLLSRDPALAQFGITLVW